MTNPSGQRFIDHPGAVPVAPGLENAAEKATGSRFALSRATRVRSSRSAHHRHLRGRDRRRDRRRARGAAAHSAHRPRHERHLLRTALDTSSSSPWFGTHNPLLIVAIPVGGRIIVGLMARYGSAAIRGHGIPEVMERVLYGESRIPARVLFLKPISAAIAIGTGGPFGAEGPIIATGGALGSLAGQVLHVTADERKTLLAAGAAAGMAATFGSPVSAVLLAVELLLFEYRPRSLIPVALAAAVATGIRVAFSGTAPIFAIAPLAQPSGIALMAYAVLGLIIGVCRRRRDAVLVRNRRGLREVRRALSHPLDVVARSRRGRGRPDRHRSRRARSASATRTSPTCSRVRSSGAHCSCSWCSSSSRGRCISAAAHRAARWRRCSRSAPGIGAWIGEQCAALAPWLGIDAHVAGLVGMAAIFAGASHALLTSVVFAFETTRQPFGLLPLLAGCTASYLVALLAQSKLDHDGEAGAPRREPPHRVRRRLPRPGARARCGDARRRDAARRRHDRAGARSRSRAMRRARRIRGSRWSTIDGSVLGVLTRRELLDSAIDGTQTVAATIARAPVVVFDDSSLRDAADQMVAEEVGRLPVVEREEPHRLVGIISRSDLLAAHEPRLHAASRVQRGRPLASWAPRR